MISQSLNQSLPHPAPQMIAPLLQAYDESSQSKQFAQNSYSCSICLTWLKGSKCLQLQCKHIFCRSCLEDFWKMCIQEGDVGRVACPDPECIKKGTEAGEEEVARVVTQDELTRWKWLREKRAYERGRSKLCDRFVAMINTVYNRSKHYSLPSIGMPSPCAQTCGYR